MNILLCKDYEGIVVWLPDGKSFRIINPKEFTATILPLHLKEAKYSSFKRKMHRWGFEHVRDVEVTTSRGAKCFGLETTFSHKFFQKGRPHLLERMACAKSQPSKSKAMSSIRRCKESISSPKVGSDAPSTPPPIDNCPDLLACQRFASPNKAALPVHSNHKGVERTHDPEFRPLSSNMNRMGLMCMKAMRLNAAIELEVVRRLQKKISANNLNNDSRMAAQQYQQMQARHSGRVPARMFSY